MVFVLRSNELQSILHVIFENSHIVASAEIFRITSTCTKVLVFSFMASTVVVIDASFRRVTIRTTPGEILSDVLQEACTKLGADASRYGLK